MKYALLALLIAATAGCDTTTAYPVQGPPGEPGTDGAPAPEQPAHASQRRRLEGAPCNEGDVEGNWWAHVVIANTSSDEMFGAQAWVYVDSGYYRHVEVEVWDWPDQDAVRLNAKCGPGPALTADFLLP